MAAHHASPRPARNLDCAAQSRLDDYRCAPPTDVCKISIGGSTPPAASNNFPAPGDFLRCVTVHITSDSADLPTFCRRDAPLLVTTAEHRPARAAPPQTVRDLLRGRPTTL